MINVWSSLIARIRRSINHRNSRGTRDIRRIRRRRVLRSHEHLEDRTLLSAIVIVNEGETAYNTGTFSGILPEDVDGSSIQTTVGSVSWNSGTGEWSWQFSTTDGPAETQTVYVGALLLDGSDFQGASFELVVNNVVPSVQGPAPGIISNPAGAAVGNNPSNLVSANGFIYFEADDPATGGRSFYVNDGTNVINLSDQSSLYLGSSLFYGPTVARIGNKIFFVARRNDGSILGPADVYCYEAGGLSNLTGTSGPDDVHEIAAVGNTLYISGVTSQFELWKYDSSGLALEILGETLNSISNLTPGDDEIFFAGNYPTRDLYRWDGTTLSNLTSATGMRVSGQPKFTAGSVYFRDQYSKLIQYDGTSFANLSDTVLSGYSIVDFSAADGHLVVLGGTSSTQSYFRIDGTTLTDLLANTGLSAIGSPQFFGTGNDLYFQAVRLADPTATSHWFKRHAGTIEELPDWGSARFETLVGDGQGGVVGSIQTPDIGYFQLVGFSDGRLRNLTPFASLTGTFSGAVSHGSDLYFTSNIQTYSPHSATFRTNRLIYRFDGLQVRELTGISIPGYYSNYRYGFEDLEILSTDATGVYFTGTDADNGITGLWRVEGTEDPVLITAQFVPSSPVYHVAGNDYFFSNLPGSGYRLIRANGPNGAVDISNGQALPDLPFQIAGSADNNLYFLSNVVTNPFLGTSERRVLHFDGNAYTSFSVPGLVHSEQSYGLNYSPYIPYEINFGGGQLLLKGDPNGDGYYGINYGIYVLWRFDGTNYHEIHRYSPDPWYAVWNSTPPVTQSSSQGVLPDSEIFVLGESQYFFGFVPGSGYQLFELNGLLPAVSRTPGYGLPTLPTDLVRLGPDLYSIDGMGNFLLHFEGAGYSPLPGPFESPFNLRSVAGKLYFNAHPTGNPSITDLWEYDSSSFPAFTRIVDGMLLENPLIVSPTDRSLFFTARVPGASETHLYSYDGGTIRDLFLHRNLTVVGSEFLQTDFVLYLNAQVPGATGHDAYRFGLANVVINEGETAHFSGTWFDPGIEDVYLDVDYGTITHYPDGTWDWSFDSIDGPDESHIVTVTATDSDGTTSTLLIHLTVLNVAPGLNLDHDSVSVYYKASATNSGTWSEVGSDDVGLSADLGEVIDNFNGTWSWSIDTLAAGLSVGTHVVTITATDSDGAVTTKTFDLVVSPRAILYTPGPVRGSGFLETISIGNYLYYAGSTPDGGIELWKNRNGSTTPELVKDIFPGDYYSFYTNSYVPFSSNPRHLTEMGGVLYFIADNTTYGSELWRSDGTFDGTYVVKDIVPGIDSSYINQLYVYNGALYFSAYDPAHGNELWKSDGTEAGTGLLADIVPGPNGYGSPGGFFEFQGRLWFTAYSFLGAYYPDLWSTDGTTEGTRLELHGSTVGGIVAVVPSGDTLFIRGASGYFLYASDGTDAGTHLLQHPASYSPYQIQGMQDLHGTLIFIAYDLSVSGTRLWKSDGTLEGTTTIGSVVPDIYGPPMVELNGYLYFVGNDGLHGNELWRTDGTVAGTELVFDSIPGADASSYYSLFAANGRLFFATSDYVVGGRLFVSDGTSAGTEEYVPLAAPSLGAIALPNFTMHMDRLYFWSYSYDAPHTQIELYATADTFPLPPNVPPVIASSSPSVTVDEGTVALMSGTFSDTTGATVTFSADFGTVIRTSASTWAWSWSTVGAPPSPVTVTITADDHRGGITQIIFDVLLNNLAPSVAADQPSVTTTEGGSPTLTGTWSDPGTDPVTLSASVGSIVKHPDGTWSWEWTDANHPANLQTVVITADDGEGGIATTSFDVIIDNVAPSYLRVHSGSIPENGIYHLVGSFYDPGEFNTHTLYIDWNDGSLLETVILPVGARTFDITHRYLDDAPSSWFVDVLPISVSLGDDRGGAAYLDPPTSNLVAWYKGEHNAVDSSLSDLSLPYHGYLNNGVGFTSGMVGEAFDFDGIDDYVTAPSVTLPSGNADRTVSLWVRIDNVVAPESFFAGYGVFGSYGQVFVIGASGTSLFFSNWGAGISGGTLTLGQWHHVAVSLQSSYATLYLDGSPVAAGLFGIDTPVGLPFVMGSIPGPHGDIRKLDGAIDDVEVYNTPLNGVQIQSIYNSGLTGLEAAVHPPYVAVENVAPTFEAGSNESLPVETFLFNRTGISITDPGSLDTFSGTVDYGDGSGPQPLTIDSINRTFDLLHFYPTYGLYTVTVTINDDDGGTHTDSFNVTVPAPNHNPILDIDGSPTLDPISVNQSTVGNPGTLISDLIARMAPDGGISDVDPGALQGIGINGADNSHGQWQYSIDGGLNWAPVGNANNDQARLLSADSLTRLRFVPNTGFAGEAKIAFVAWDQTQGSNGGLGITKSRFGTSPFSLLYEYASIIVVNTAPVLDADGRPLFDPISVNVPNEQNHGTLVSDLIDRMSPFGGISDSYAGAPLGIAINGLTNTSNGLWQFTVNNGTNWTPVGTTGNTNARLLAADGNTRIRFVPNNGFRGEAKIAFVAWDRTSGANGGVADVRSRGGSTAFSLAYEYASLFINNHAPVLTVSGTAHLDSIPRNIPDSSNVGTRVSDLIARMGPGGGISDPDPNDVVGIAINGLVGTSTGTWEFTTDGGTSWTAIGTTGNSNGRLLSANSLTRIRYRPNPGFFGTVKFAFVGWDGTSGLNGGVAAVGTRGGSTPYSLLYDYTTLVVSS